MSGTKLTTLLFVIFFLFIGMNSTSLKSSLRTQCVAKSSACVRGSDQKCCQGVLCFPHPTNRDLGFFCTTAKEWHAANKSAM